MEELPGEKKKSSYVDFPGSPERTEPECEVAAGDIADEHDYRVTIYPAQCATLLRPTRFDSNIEQRPQIMKFPITSRTKEKNKP
jgi:hypothetical protein